MQKRETARREVQFQRVDYLLTKLRAVCDGESKRSMINFMATHESGR